MNQKFDPKLLSNQGTQPGQIVITKEIIEQAEDITCINQLPKLDTRGKIIDGEFILCNGQVFTDAFRLKYVSPILSPTGKQTIGNLFIGKICLVCGKIFNPDEWVKQRDEHVKATKNTILDKENKDAKTKL